MIGKKLITQARISTIRHNSDVVKVPTPNDSESFLIFPFRINGGFINSTEAGQQPFNSSSRDFTTFKRVFTGKEAIIAQWDKSTQAIQQDDGSYNATYQVGRYEKGYISSEDLGAIWQNNVREPDFKEQIVEKTITMISTDWDEVSLQYKDVEEMIYLIPEVEANQWMYISNVSINRNSKGEFAYATITFSSLNDKVAKSGRAVEQFIQISGAGEGGAFPKITFNEVVNPNNSLEVKRIRQVELDKEKLLYRPIDNIQIEFYGIGAISNISAMGRPIGINNSVNKIEAPRRLLPADLLTPISTDINRASLPTSNFVWIQNFAPQIVENFKSWQDKVKAQYQDVKEANYYGTIKTNDQADVLATNPIINGLYSHSIWDDNFLINTHIKNYDTKGEYQTTGVLDYRDTMLPHEIMAHNVFAHSHIQSLPMSLREIVPWNSTSIPLISKFLPFEKIGLPVGWQNSQTWIKSQPVNVFMPSEAYRLLSQLQLGTNDGLDILPFDTFLGENSLNALLGFKALNMTYRIALTDKMSLPTFTEAKETKQYVWDPKNIRITKPFIDRGASGGTIRYDFTGTYEKDGATLNWKKGTGFTIEALKDSNVKGVVFRIDIEEDIPNGGVKFGTIRLESHIESNIAQALELSSLSISNIKITSIKEVNLITGSSEEILDKDPYEVITFTKQTDKEYNTLYLGQKVDEKGANILPNGSKLVWNKFAKPIGKGSTLGYAIDLIRWQGIFNGVYKITAFQGNNQVWTSAYLSNGAFTENPRDWTNAVKTSNWDNVNMLGTQVQWPQIVSAPETPDFDKKKHIHIDVRSNLSFHDNKKYTNDKDTEQVITYSNNNEHLVDLKNTIDVGTFKNFYDSITITFSGESIAQAYMYKDNAWPLSNDEEYKTNDNKTENISITIGIDDLLSDGKVLYDDVLTKNSLPVFQMYNKSIGKQSRVRFREMNVENRLKITSTNNFLTPLKFEVITTGGAKLYTDLRYTSADDTYFTLDLKSNVNIVDINLNPKLS